MTGKTDEIVTYVQQQTDRLAQMIDGKRGILVEAIGGKTNQLTVDIDRVTSDALKSIETRGQAFSQSMIDQRFRRRADDYVGRRIGHRRRQQVAERPRAVVAGGDRPVASGVDRGSDRNAGNQQDPAHRHGRPVRAPARRQYPAAGGAHRRPRQSQFARASAGHAGGRLRLRDERRHLAQRRRDPDAGRPVERLQRQDLEGAGRSRLAFQPVRDPRQGAGRSRDRGRAKQPQHHRLGRRAQIGAGIRWSPRSICGPPISISGCRVSPACSTNCWPPPKSAPAISRAWWRKPPAPARPRSAGSSRRFAPRPKRNAG